MIVRLYAMHRGVARCALAAVPEPPIIPIHNVTRYTGLARLIDGGLAPD